MAICLAQGLIVGLADPDSGDIRCGDQLVSSEAFLASKMLRRSIQMVFQDPYSSFNPRMKIGQALISGSVAGGEGKAEAIKKMLKGPITPRLPASILRGHANVTVLLDRGAASKL